MKAQTDLAFHGLVHDLNNVFATILDAGDLLEADPEWSWLGKVVQRNALLGRRILESFADSGRKPVSVNAVIESARALAADSLQAQDCAVQFDCKCDPDLKIRGSDAAWERAFVNLLINAGQAMGPDGGVVAVRARQADSRAEITITDSGPGIPDDHLAQIFEPGFSTKPERSGMGLHIAQTIVRENGGSISAANRADASGAVFTIVAPAEKAPAA